MSFELLAALARDRERVLALLSAAAKEEIRVQLARASDQLGAGDLVGARSSEGRVHDLLEEQLGRRDPLLAGHEAGLMSGGPATLDAAEALLLVAELEAAFALPDHGEVEPPSGPDPFAAARAGDGGPDPTEWPPRLMVSDQDEPGLTEWPPEPVPVLFDVEAEVAEARRRLLAHPQRTAEEIRAAGGDPGAAGVIGLPRPDGSVAFPDFQFGPDGRPPDTVRRVNVSLGAESDPWAVADWWYGYNAYFGEPPVEILGAHGPDDERLLTVAAAAHEEGE